MLTISSLHQKFKQLDTDKVIQESLIETKDNFETANKAQLRAGKTKTGESIRPGYRSRSYARLKNAMNPSPGLGIPDLHLTGNFYKGIDAEPNLKLGVFDIISKDEKGPELEDKYPNIFGLGTDYKKQYLDDSLRPAVKRRISKAVGLKFE